MNTVTRTRTRGWTRTFRHQSLTIRLLAASAGLLTAAAASTAPAEASPSDDAFVGALGRAGLNVGAPNDAVSMGQSLCPMLAKPGGNFIAAVERVRGGNSMSPEMAQMFATIAIQMYCPSMMTSLAHGQMPALPSIPGVPKF